MAWALGRSKAASRDSDVRSKLKTTEFLEGLDHMVHEPATPSPGSLQEMQYLGPHIKPTESELAFSQPPLGDVNAH